MKFFSVKTVYRWEIGDESKKSPSLIEERVLIFKARNSDSALKKAIKEARAYAKYNYINVHGKKVIKKFLGFMDAYEMDGAPELGMEIYSSNQLLNSNMSDKAILDEIIDFESNLSERKINELRKCFQHR